VNVSVSDEAARTTIVPVTGVADGLALELVEAGAGLEELAALVPLELQPATSATAVAAVTVAVTSLVLRWFMDLLVSGGASLGARFTPAARGGGQGPR
jgi:hypothetical protein